MRIVADVLLCSILCIPSYLLMHLDFSATFENDVKFAYGKHRMRNNRKNARWLSKFLFLYVRKEVKKWHYVEFLINLISFIIFYFSLVLYIISENNIIGIISGISGLISMISVGCSGISYYLLHKWDIGNNKEFTLKARRERKLREKRERKNKK